MKQVPISVSKLAPKVDFFCELDNSPLLSEVEIRTEGITWESFKANWEQTCAYVPGQRRLGGVRPTFINAIDPKDFESIRFLERTSVDDSEEVKEKGSEKKGRNMSLSRSGAERGLNIKD